MPVEDGSDDIDAETTGAEVATSPLTAERTQEPDAVATEPATIDAEYLKKTTSTLAISKRKLPTIS